MRSYTPFDKKITDLDEDELQKLTNESISEGWYIEYKAEIPKKGGKIDGSKIAKTISAFANTKGGWLFYGIQSNERNMATCLTGIDISEYNNLSDDVSRIISSNINPKPVYHFKLVPLKSGKYIFVIQIEESPMPPYITSTGIVFQRENNESNPIKDRYILEKLAEKTDNYYAAIDRFCQIDYGQTKGQADSGQSYLELYLFPLPFDGFRFNNFHSSDFFKKVADVFCNTVNCYTGENKEFSISGNALFNSVYSSERSIIIRPLTDDTLIYKTATAELFLHGGLKLLLPLSEFDINCVPSCYRDSNIIRYLTDRYTLYGTTERRKDTGFADHIKMIDGLELIVLLLVIMAKYKIILEYADFDLSSEIGHRVRLTDTWRKFVFFDNDDYLEKIKQFNLPIAPKNQIEIPTFIKGNYNTTKLDEPSLFLDISVLVLKALGLPDFSSIKFDEIFVNGLALFSKP
jgi:hypothetical protein